jgi:AmiR/NasT family two-component response regulator
MDDSWIGRRKPRLPRSAEWVCWRNPRHAKSQWWAELQGSLQDRKLIERAKGVLMRQLQVDEQDAYRLLKKWSNDSNGKLSAVAR